MPMAAPSSEIIGDPDMPPIQPSSHSRWSKDPPGALHPNGSILLMLVTWIGSVVFGWMHQALWLPVPPVAFISYALLEVGRNSAWAKREMDLTWRSIFDTWVSGLPFVGYGRFMFGNPAVGLVLFGLAWVASSLF
jgi:hypothetical protein